MPAYTEILAQDQRRAVLECLSEDADYSHNEGVIQRMLAATGHRVSRDQVRSAIAWLAEQGLVTVEEVSGLQVARLTARGLDCAEGATVIPGVGRRRL